MVKGGEPYGSSRGPRGLGLTVWSLPCGAAGRNENSAGTSLQTSPGSPGYGAGGDWWKGEGCYSVQGSLRYGREGFHDAIGQIRVA